MHSLTFTVLSIKIIYVVKVTACKIIICIDLTSILPIAVSPLFSNRIAAENRIRVTVNCCCVLPIWTRKKHI